MRILFVLENYYPNVGGVETLFKNLIEQLAEKGHQVKLITTQLNPEDPLEEKIGNIHIYRYPFRNRYIFTFFGVFPIYKLAKDCDLIHTTSYNAGVPAWLGAKLRRKKVVITFHEVWGKLWFDLPFMNKIMKWGHYYFEQMLLKMSFDRFIAVSESTAQSLKKEGVESDRICINHNGINYDKFEHKTAITSVQNKKFTYTYFGRLGMSKGLDLLLEAAAIMKEEHPNSCLQMIIPKTPAPLFNEVLKVIKQYELSEYMELKHSLPIAALFSKLKASDCIVIPSYSEGFCFAAVEAIAMRIPLISSDRAALKEVVSGQFIKMENHTAQGLVLALKRAIKGDWDYAPIKKFELQENTIRYISLYEELLNLDEGSSKLKVK